MSLYNSVHSTQSIYKTYQIYLWIVKTGKMHIYTINKVYITTLPTKDNFLSLSFQKKKNHTNGPMALLGKNWSAKKKEYFRQTEKVILNSILLRSSLNNQKALMEIACNFWVWLDMANHTQLKSNSYIHPFFG